jgi:hypothetical protein
MYKHFKNPYFILLILIVTTTNFSAKTMKDEDSGNAGSHSNFAKHKDSKGPTKNSLTEFVELLQAHNDLLDQVSINWPEDEKKFIEEKKGMISKDANEEEIEDESNIRK